MAAGFTDAQGRHWSLRIDIAAQRRIRNALDINILDIGDGSLLTRLGEDAVVLVDVLWCICAEQARQRNIDEEQFALCFGDDGEVIDAASRGLVEAIIDFFPQRRRTALRQILARADAEMETAMQHLERHLSSSSSSAPPSPGSATSAPGASASSPGPPTQSSETPGHTPAV